MIFSAYYLFYVEQLKVKYSNLGILVTFYCRVNNKTLW